MSSVEYLKDQFRKKIITEKIYIPAKYDYEPETHVESGSMAIPTTYEIFGFDTDGDGILDMIYVRDGITGRIVYKDSDAATAINWAIANAPPGSKISIKRGIYKIRSTILLKEGICLEGEQVARHSPGQPPAFGTVLWCEHSGDMLQGVELYDVQIKNLYLYGNNKGTNAIVLGSDTETGGTRITLKNLFIADFNGVALKLRSVSQCVLEKLYCVGNGSSIDMAYSAVTNNDDITIISCWFQGKGTDYIKSANMLTVISTVFTHTEDIAGYGLLIENVNASAFISCHFEEPTNTLGYYVRVAGSEALSFINCHFHGTPPTNYQMLVRELGTETITAFMLLGCRFPDNTNNLQIYPTTSPCSGLIANNKFGGTVDIGGAGKKMNFLGNDGYVTENEGIATFSGDEATTVFQIEHGLAAAPSKYIVTPLSPDADAPRTITVDATYITITFSTPPPSGTDNIKFGWWAKV